MNILIDGIIFARQCYGGISRVWEEYLKRLPSYGININLLIPNHHNNSSLARILSHRDCYHIIKDHFYWPRRFFERVPVRSRFLKNQMNGSVQLFQTTYFSTIYCNKTPKVVMVHDMIPEKFQKTDKRYNPEIEMKGLALFNADRIIAISNSTKNDLLDIYPTIPPEKVTVIPHGVVQQSNKNYPSFTEVVQKHHLALQPKSYFLYVGLRGGYKNFQIILDLVQKLPEYRNYQFLCIGGEVHADLSAWLHAMNLHQSFLFLDYISDEDLSIFYQNAFALVYPSRYEGFGLPVIEAMANSCPVLCSNTSSLPEVGGDAAFYFDPCSIDSFAFALSEMISSSREERIEMGLRNIERFSWDYSTQSLVRLYHDLVS